MIFSFIALLQSLKTKAFLPSFVKNHSTNRTWHASFRECTIEMHESITLFMLNAHDLHWRLRGVPSDSTLIISRKKYSPEVQVSFVLDDIVTNLRPLPTYPRNTKPYFYPKQLLYSIDMEPSTLDSIAEATCYHDIMEFDLLRHNKSQSILLGMTCYSVSHGYKIFRICSKDDLKDNITPESFTSIVKITCYTTYLKSICNFQTNGVVTCTFYKDFLTIHYPLSDNKSFIECGIINRER